MSWDTGDEEVPLKRVRKDSFSSSIGFITPSLFFSRREGFQGRNGARLQYDDEGKDCPSFLAFSFKRKEGKKEKARDLLKSFSGKKKQDEESESKASS